MFKNKFVVRKDFIIENRDNENFFIIDARGDMLKVSDFIYDRSIVMDWKEFTFLSGEQGGEYIGLYFDKENLLKKFSKYGINKNSKVLVYVDTKKNCSMGEDGRFKFLLNFCDIDCYILDGGIDEVLKTKYFRKVDQLKDLKKAQIDSHSKPFLNYEKSILTSELLDIYKNDNLKLLDVRYKEEYDGKIIFGEKFGGHIKGALSFPFTSLYDENGYLLDNEKIENLILSKGISKEDMIISYCTTGIRASIVYEILNMLGFKIRVYDESFSRWCVVGEYEI